MAYESDLMSHVLIVNECLQRHGATAELDSENLQLKVRGGGKYIELLPQFIFPKDGSIAFSPRLLDSAQGFCGWRAYFNRLWPLAIDKLEFKRYCLTHGLRTPRHWMDARQVDADAILKKSRSSFAQGMSSPYTPAALHSKTLSLSEGDFFEQFIFGTIAKIWYWNAAPVCLDLRAMPEVVGNGRSTLQQLITQLALPYSPIDWQALEPIADYQGLSLASVPEQGRRVLVDFRFLSGLHPLATFVVNQNVLGTASAAIRNQLMHVGQLFHRSLPEPLQGSTLYSVDAIVDPKEQIWFLEMNCNPIVHPDVYPFMFESFFASNSARAVH